MKILALDIESTGPDPYRDQIIEIAIVNDDGDALVNTRARPSIPISSGARQVTGICDHHLVDCPTFSEIAAQVQDTIEGAIILGYSSRTFDTVILDAELRRAGQEGIDLNTVHEIDLYRVWQELEPRTLIGAVKRFMGKEHEGAHGALVDAVVLHGLMDCMLEAFFAEAIRKEERRGAIYDLMQLSRPSWEVDRSGKLRKDDDGTVCWNFGQHRGEPVVNHVGLIYWVLERDFPEPCKEALREILAEMQERARIENEDGVPL